MKFKKLICMGIAVILIGSSLPQRIVQAQEIPEQEINQQDLQNLELNLEDVKKAESNQIEQQYGNFKYKERKDGTLEITDYKQETNVAEIAVPAEIEGKKVTSIGRFAFGGCSGLSNISLPKGLTSIGRFAFEGCSNLSSISLPEELISIGEGIFTNCNSLKNVNIPKGVVSIGIDIFSGCSSLKEIIVDESNIAYVSKDGILYNKDMTTLIRCPEGKIGEIVIPEEVTSVEEYAFSDCSGLNNISIPKGVTSIKSAAFSGCSGLNNISLPKGVTSIGDRAFSGCSNLGSIAIPEGVTKIKAFTFSDCSNLKSIRLPKKLSAIGIGVFSGCVNLKSIDIPEGVTSIEESTFFRCINLSDIDIPKEVTFIGESAFSVCVNLKSITIPEKVAFIGYDAFWECSSLSEIIVNKDNTEYSSKNGMLYNKTMTTLIYCPEGKTGEVVIPKGVTTIESMAFGDCNNLNSVSIPEEVTSIEDSAFHGCSDNLTLIVAQDSYAESYAKEKAIPYRYVECEHTCQFKSTKATTKKNGSIKEICSKCGEQKGKTTVIYAAKNVKLSKISFTYNNKVQKPSVIIKDSKGKALKEGTDYVVTYPKGTKNVGKYTVTIQLKGNYKGTIEKSFTITPKAVNIAKITAKSKGFTVNWKKQTKQVTGYEISYSTSKKFAKQDTKAKLISSGKTSAKTISKLKAKKKYYVKIRTYKTVNIDGKSTKLYSNWSKVKTVTTKK